MLVLDDRIRGQVLETIEFLAGSRSRGIAVFRVDGKAGWGLAAQRETLQ